MLFSHDFLNAGRHVHRGSRTLGGDFVEALPAGTVDCVFARQGLPATDGDINKTWLDLKCKTAPSNPLGSK